MNLYHRRRRHRRTRSPGGHRARYLDSLASPAVGVPSGGGARACGLVSVARRPVGGTRGLCRSNSPVRYACLACFPSVKVDGDRVAANKKPL